MVTWPDVSAGIVREMLGHPADWMEWPISGDNLKCRQGDALIYLVDWVALGEDETLCPRQP